MLAAGPLRAHEKHAHPKDSERNPMPRMTVEELIDRQEIDDLLIRYATAVDTQDWDLYETCFTADAFIDYESAGGIKGKLPEVRAWLEKTLVMFPMTQHVVCNRAVDIDGDTGTARSVFYNPMGLPQGDAGSI